MIDGKILSILYKYTLPSSTRRELSGIYFHEGRVIASDGHVLFNLKLAYEAGLEGRIMGRKDEVSDCTYPDVKGVTPDIANMSKSEDIVLDNLKKACRNLGHTRKSGDAVCINVGGLCFLPWQVLDIIKVFELLGERYDLYTYPGLPAVFSTENHTALLMPWPNVEEFNKIPVEDAADFGDML